MKTDALPPHPNNLRMATPLARIAALADPGSVNRLPPAGASRHLARYGIVPHDDDGVVTAHVRLQGTPMLIAAQDERFLSGSVGEQHGRALHGLVDEVQRSDAEAIVLLLASGGVRLHEATPAELALARTLAAFLDARVAGVPVIAVAVGLLN
jgi:malonate decarboxylase beta subunit